MSKSLIDDKIYAADNIGFVYVISYKTGNVIWKKNYGIPFKSNIKVYKNKIFIINQDNTILCINSDNGEVVWDVSTINTFIKSQNTFKKGSGILITLFVSNVSWFTFIAACFYGLKTFSFYE